NQVRAGIRAADHVTNQVRAGIRAADHITNQVRAVVDRSTKWRRGEEGAQGAQLGGGRAPPVLVVRRGQEVPVHRVGQVDADPAVHVHRGVGDAVTRIGRPEL